jgi:adenosylmethionine-8-amino-7-oxononanoate aminotransferase
MRQKFLDRGFLIRPLGNTLYLMPPYCLTNEQRLEIFANIADVIREIA